MGELTDRISQSNVQMQAMLAGMSQRFAGSIDPEGAALKAVWGMLQRQATILAFGDAFAMLAMACAVAAVVTLFARPVKTTPGAPPLEAH